MRYLITVIALTLLAGCPKPKEQPAPAKPAAQQPAPPDAAPAKAPPALPQAAAPSLPPKAPAKCERPLSYTERLEMDTLLRQLQAEQEKIQKPVQDWADATVKAHLGDKDDAAKFTVNPRSACVEPLPPPRQPAPQPQEVGP